MRLARFTILTLLALPLLAAPLGIEAQPGGKIYRIGVLGNERGGPPWEGFRQGLRDLGYVEMSRRRVETQSTRSA